MSQAEEDQRLLRDVRAAFQDTGHSDVSARPGSSAGYIRQTPRQPVWDALQKLPTLSTVASLQNGIRYTRDPEFYIPETPLPEYSAGVPEVKGYAEPYFVQDIRYLSLDAKEIKGKPLQFAWGVPKVLLNRARVSIGFWCLAAAVETTGLYATRQFYGVWPKAGMPVAVLAAILNGPVANAFVFDHRAGIDNYPALINRIPIPDLTPEHTNLIVSLVDAYRSCREWLRQEPERSAALEPRCRDLLLQIDAAVLDAYGLTAEQENLLLKAFEGVQRPLLPFALQGYGADYTRAKQTVAAKRRWNAIITRYHALVDKEFDNGLTPEEEAEQERLAKEIDAEEARENETLLARVPAGLK